MEKPNRKVTVGVGCGAFVAVTSWVLEQFFHITMPAHIAVELATALTFLVQYHVRERK